MKYKNDQSKIFDKKNTKLNSMIKDKKRKKEKKTILIKS